MEYVEISAKTVSDAITEACQKLGVTSDKLDYQVIEEGSAGFLGIGSKPAVIKAAKKCSVEDNAKIFLNEVFAAMNMTVNVAVKYDEQENNMDIDLTGDEMGVLIGKRGQTLDSLQYLVSLVVNKNTENYIRVKVDTENYRERRKETLENLAKNIAYKVKRNRKPVSLEPMNPYERRIIHSALQNDKYVTTHSEGDEPFRRVVVTLKRDSKDYQGKGYNRNRYYNREERVYNEENSGSEE
jgi:spoIIIJ-associated protein